nr:DNA cytosine methyltransferase [Fuerstiella marisgermanici]
MDLFCGVGGLTHGLAKAGIDVVAGFDTDALCEYAYESNNDATFVREDVGALVGKDIRALWDKDTTTLLAGCAPCQPFSTYSRASRKDKPDEKWELVRHFSRLVGEAKPDLVTMENVAQIVRHDVFQEFLESLAGYSIWHSVVECRAFGVPQTRKRLVLLASKLGPIKMSRPNPSAGKATVATAISRLPQLAAGESDCKDPLHHACNLSAINLKRIRASQPGGTWRDWPVSLRANCHKQEAGETYPSVYGRMQWDEPAPTITTQCFGYGNGRFGHPEQDRAITLREAAMLQTFPRRYKFLRAKEKVVFHTMGRLIGNAVPVRLGHAIGRSFVEHVNMLERDA